MTRKEEASEIRQIIERVVEWSKCHPGATLNELEAQVQKAVLELRQKVMEATVEAQETGLLKQEHCPCGGRRVFQGYQKRTLMTSLGGIEIERAYYTCEKCQADFYPLDEQLKEQGKRSDAPERTPRIRSRRFRTRRGRP